MFSPSYLATRLFLDPFRIFGTKEQCAFSSETKLTKKFTINGGILVSQYNYYEVLDPKEENEKKLLPSIRVGSFFMLHGARGSGKSRRAFRAIDQLKESFVCIYMTMQFVQPDTFNVAESVRIQYWTRDQVSTLLRQHIADVIDDVISDIHQRTAGHAGLVCMCGKAIAELDPRMATNYNLWIRFATTKLVTTTIKNWQTMPKMTTQLALTKSDTDRSQEEIQRAFEARNFLRMVMAGGLNSIEVGTKEMIKLGKYLVAEGALVALDSQTFTVPSPLLYS